MAETTTSVRPRLLVTGFSVFPGAPVNPTERLVAAFPSRWAEDAGDLRAVCLDVDYRALPSRLAVIGRDFAPDIAIHFGLSNKAVGFTLERSARNGVCLVKPDNTGFTPTEPRIGETPEHPSGLPLQAIHAALVEQGLPVAYSESAGDYLCNYLFYLSCGGGLSDGRALQSGFIHVPNVGPDRTPGVIDEEQLLTGAILIARTCCARWDRDQLAAAEKGETCEQSLSG